MMKLVLGMMCVGLSVGILAGCTSSTMPAPNDPATAIHEEPGMSADASQTNPALATSPAPRKTLTESVAAAK